MFNQYKLGFTWMSTLRLLYVTLWGLMQYCMDTMDDATEAAISRVGWSEGLLVPSGNLYLFDLRDEG